MTSVKKHLFFWIVFWLYLASYVLAASAGTLPKNYEVNPGILQDGYESVSGWTVAQSCSSTFTLNADPQFIRTGIGSAKFTIPAGGCGVTATKVISQVVNHNLFGLWLYVSPSPNNNISGITLSFCQNTGCTITFSKALTSSNTRFVSNGWNWIVVHRDDFINTGSNSWTAVQNKMRVAVTTSSGGAGTFYVDDYYIGFYNRPKIILRFDDGSSTETAAIASMTAMGYPASICVIGSLTGAPGKFTLAQLQAYQSQGHEICNHTWSHQNAATLGDTAFIDDVNTMKSYMKANGLFGWDVLAFPNSVPVQNTNLLAGLSVVAGDSSLFYTTYHKGIASPYYFYLKDIGTPNVSVSTSIGYVKDAIKYGALLVALFHTFEADPPINTGNWSIERFNLLVQELKRFGPQIDVITQKEFIEGLEDPRRKR